MYNISIYFQYCSYNTGIVKNNVVFVLKVANGFSKLDFNSFFVSLILFVLCLKRQFGIFSKNKNCSRFI